ncbi:MAG: HDIG domain-containing protein [bacterium]|nr:HDIG domain-containing protein [bacterium]
MSEEKSKRERRFEDSPIFHERSENFTGNFFQRLQMQVSSFLTRSRPADEVRRMQLILLGITILIVTFALSYPGFAQSDLDLSPDGPYRAGNTATQDVVAGTDIEFVLEKSLEEARVRAARNAPIRLTRDFGVLSKPAGASADPDEELSFSQMLANDLDQVAGCRGPGGTAGPNCVRRNVPHWRSLTDNEIYNLTSLDQAALLAQIERIVSILFSRFVFLEERIPVPEFRAFAAVKMSNINYTGATEPGDPPAENVIQRRNIRDGSTLLAFEREATNLMPELSALRRRALAKLSQSYLKDLKGSRFDLEDSQQAREKARNEVPVSEHVRKIKRGQAIVQKGQIISEEDYQALDLHQEGRAWDRFWQIVAILVQQAILMGLLLYFAMRFATRQISAVSSNLIVFITIWLFALLILALEGSWTANANHNEVTHFFGAWVPIGLFAVMFAIIFGEVFSLPIALYMAFLVFISSRYDGVSLMISATLGVVGAILGARIKKRVQFITTALMLAGINFVLVSVGYLYGGRPILAGAGIDSIFSEHYAEAVSVALLSGVLTFIVMIVLPVYETLFNIPTRFRLAELADPSHPLLKEMFKLAPSTWTHTLMVAALVEKACERLGLNVPLARTGIYFHDIGKMRNAGFFIENQHLIPKPENVDRDKPQVAARVIIDHVLDGIKMAEAYRLPREVIAFIPEHHGTSTMAFFYHKALEKMKRKVRREDFRYPGPIPQSKETGIAMIADSVEAASRSLDEVTEESLNNLIQKITNIKVQENQLDESGLTMGDLSVVKEAFVDVLISSFHSRPKYPNQADTEKLESRNQSGAALKSKRKKTAAVAKSSSKASAKTRAKPDPRKKKASSRR